MKECGILLHVSSLPGKNGIGSFGAEAYGFVDFLREAGQSYWQVLPLGVTSYGDSPYQTFSVNAGNPYFIDLAILAGDGLIDTDTDCDWENDTAVDYAKLYNVRYKLLETIDKSKIDNAAFNAFCDNNSAWLNDFALFMALKKHYGGKGWYEWESKHKYREPDALREFEQTHNSDVILQKIYQYLFFKQWLNLKQYAGKAGVRIIGDMPIYVAYDSADVWANPQLFDLDGDLKMKEVAGVPPDAFSDDGQLWGNPLYNWEYMKKTGYAWWIARIKSALMLYDCVRIDHFRGFESYFAIPAANTDAKQGKWRKGPGAELFNIVNRELPGANIIAEDLGIITPEVGDMLKASGYPGMKVLQFAFNNDSGNEHLPENYKSGNIVAYTGTHDNDTISGWYSALTTEEKKYFKLKTGGEKAAKSMVKLLYSSCAGIAIVPFQDFLELGAEARMNTPSTMGGNWKWRAEIGCFDIALARKIRRLAKRFGRERNS